MSTRDDSDDLETNLVGPFDNGHWSGTLDATLSVTVDDLVATHAMVMTNDRATELARHAKDDDSGELRDDVPIEKRGSRPDGWHRCRVCWRVSRTGRTVVEETTRKCGIEKARAYRFRVRGHDETPNVPPGFLLSHRFSSGYLSASFDFGRELDLP